LLSVYTFRRLIGREFPAYVDTLIGPDTQYDLFRIDGDELPKDVVEVAYIPSVWCKSKGKRTETFGSALGFRTVNKNRENIIEWCCFDEEIEYTILEKWTFDQNTQAVHVRDHVRRDDPRLLFNKVATLDKDPYEDKPKQGKQEAYQEHIDWHKSLSMAKLRPRKLKVVWKTFPVEYMTHVTQRQQAEEHQDDEGQGEKEADKTSDDSDDKEEEEENDRYDAWVHLGYDSSDTMDVA
jgi:hypothetical protein